MRAEIVRGKAAAAAVRAEPAREVAGKITPAPAGARLMTITILMKNRLRAASAGCLLYR